MIKSREEKKRRFTLGGIEVYIKDPLSSDIDLSGVLEEVQRSVPSYCLNYIDVIYVGDFEVLDKKDFGAVYSEGAVYLNNKQASNEDVVSHMVHEIAHAVEHNNSSLVYTDGKIEKEFLSKREKVQSLLRAEGIRIPLEYFYKLEYDANFDDILYNQIGYPMLAMLTANIFFSPYALTSVNEYFAGAFEIFYNKRQVNYVKNLSPSVYNKIVELEDKNG